MVESFESIAKDCLLKFLKVIFSCFWRFQSLEATIDLFNDCWNDIDNSLCQVTVHRNARSCTVDINFVTLFETHLPFHGNLILSRESLDCDLSGVILTYFNLLTCLSVEGMTCMGNGIIRQESKAQINHSNSWNSLRAFLLQSPYIETLHVGKCGFL